MSCKWYKTHTIRVLKFLNAVESFNNGFVVISYVFVSHYAYHLSFRLFFSGAVSFHIPIFSSTAPMAVYWYPGIPLIPGVQHNPPPSADVYPGDAIPSAAGPLVTVTNSRRSDDPEYDQHGDFDLDGAVRDHVLDGARRLLLADYWQLDEPADDFDEEQYIATWTMEMVEARAHSIDYVIRPGCFINQINAYWHRVHKWCHLPENLIRNHGCRDL